MFLGFHFTMELTRLAYRPAVKLSAVSPIQYSRITILHFFVSKFLSGHCSLYSERALSDTDSASWFEKWIWVKSGTAWTLPRNCTTFCLMNLIFGEGGTLPKICVGNWGLSEPCRIWGISCKKLTHHISWQEMVTVRLGKVNTCVSWSGDTLKDGQLKTLEVVCIRFVKTARHSRSDFPGRPESQLTHVLSE